MTTVPTFVDSADPHAVVAMLVDAAVEAVVTSPDPGARAAVIYGLVQEMCAAVDWLLQDCGAPLDDALNAELASIGQLATAAQDHYLRMSSLRSSAAPRNTR